jgi:CRP/FNR family transcriptional regulator
MFDELKYWYLRDHKLFWTLSMSQIKQLCIITGFKKAKKGEVIYFSSSDLPRIYLLKKGNIKIVSIDEQGKETIKETFGAECDVLYPSMPNSDGAHYYEWKIWFER